MQKKIIIGIFVGFLLCFSVAGLLNKAELSFSERRKLAEWPEIYKANQKLNDKYFDEMDKYLTDHFVFRDEFRSLKALINNHLFNLSDNDGVFVEDGYIFEMDERLDEKSVDNLNKLINKVVNKYFANQEIYQAFIPRKNDYLVNNEHPDFKYQEFMNEFDNGYFKIDLYDQLTLDSYYRTDIHWRQDKLEQVAKYLVESMGDEYFEQGYEKKYFEPFYGALYGKAALALEPDEIVCLLNPMFNDVTVSSYEKQKDVPVYDYDALKHLDAYDVYLDGPTAYLDIKNPYVNNGQKLIVFRDSFGSSLIPLMIASYEEIQVVDLRYIGSDFLDRLELNQDAKVLFLYGMEVVNNSYTLK